MWPSVWWFINSCIMWRQSQTWVWSRWKVSQEMNSWEASWLLVFRLYKHTYCVWCLLWLIALVTRSCHSMRLIVMNIGLWWGNCDGSLFSLGLSLVTLMYRWCCCRCGTHTGSQVVMLWDKNPRAAVVSHDLLGCWNKTFGSWYGRWYQGWQYWILSIFAFNNSPTNFYLRVEI